MTAEPAWGVDSEYGRLLDVLLCPPDNFRWRETSAITRATLEAGHRFDPEVVAAQHAGLVAAYEEAGVRCHFLEPEPALPYEVFTRDSSTMGPDGAVITQLAQWWRRGEYAPVIRFYERAEHPDPRHDHRGIARGRRRDDRRARRGADRHRREPDPGGRRRPARGLVSRGRLGGARRAVPGALRPHRRAGRRAGASSWRRSAPRCCRTDASSGCAPRAST